MHGEFRNGAHVKLEKYFKEHPDAHLTFEDIAKLTGVQKRSASNAAHTLAHSGEVEVVMVVRLKRESPYEG